MNTTTLSAVTVLLAIFNCAATAGPLTPPALLVFFEEDFEDFARSPNLEGYAYFLVEDGVIHRHSSGGSGDRRYMRTAVNNYNSRDFIFEITFVCEDYITYIGIGHGDRGPGAGNNEPAKSVYFRIHAPTVINGGVHVSSIFGHDTETIGRITSVGPHRARIEHRAGRITFSIDDNFDGNFSADFSKTFPDLMEAGPFLEDADSHLFFGASSDNESFDDLKITSTIQRGDCSSSGEITIADPLKILRYLFEADGVDCLDACDANGDDRVSVADAFFILAHKFLGGPAPDPLTANCP